MSDTSTDDMNAWNEQIIAEFRENDGKVGGPFEGAPMVLLHHQGAKTGTERITPLMYRPLEDQAIAIFASKAGAPDNPDWYHNVKANPDTTIEIGTETRSVRVEELTGSDREPVWEGQKADVPQFADYEKAAEGRTIPVLRITPA